MHPPIRVGVAADDHAIIIDTGWLGAGDAGVVDEREFAVTQHETMGFTKWRVTLLVWVKYGKRADDVAGLID